MPILAIDDVFEAKAAAAVTRQFNADEVILW